MSAAKAPACARRVGHILRKVDREPVNFIYLGLRVLSWETDFFNPLNPLIKKRSLLMEPCVAHPSRILVMAAPAKKH